MKLTIYIIVYLNIGEKKCSYKPNVAEVLAVYNLYSVCKANRTCSKYIHWEPFNIDRLCGGVRQVHTTTIYITI